MHFIIEFNHYYYKVCDGTCCVMELAMSLKRKIKVHARDPILPVKFI